jgi:chromosome segregation protein
MVVTDHQTGARAASAEHEQQTRAALDAREAELEVARQTAHEREETAESAQTAAFTADNAVRTCEADTARARDRMGHLDQRRLTATAEQNELEGTVDKLVAERAELEGELATVEAEEARETELSLEEHEQLDGLRQGLSAADAEASSVRTRLGEASANVARAEATLLGFEQRLEEMHRRRERLDDEAGRLRYEREELASRQVQLVKHGAELAEGKRISADERTRLEQEMRALREAAVVSDKNVDHAKNELGQKRSRLRALEELHARLEGVGTGVKSLLGTKDAALGGLVADRIEAPAELTAALSGLLGERLQYVVVSDVERGVALLAELARTNRGRATLVPARPRFVAGGAAQRLAGDGVRGALVDELAFAPEDEALVRTLVGDAVVVESAEIAVALARGAGAGRTLVALDGTVVHADGRISGGSGDAVAAAMIEQKREMRELHEVVSRKGAEVTALLEAQQALRLRMSEVGTAVDRARSEAHAGELALVTAEKDLKRVEEQLAATSKRLGVVEAELGELVQALERAVGEQEEARRVLDEGMAQREELGQRLGGAEELCAEHRERVRVHEQVVTERKVKLARVRERAAGVRGTVERLARSCDELRSRIRRLDEERTECARGAGEAAALVLAGREALSAAVAEAHGAQDALIEARRALDEARHALGTREADLRGLRTELGEAVERVREHDMALQRLEIERGHVVEGVRERFRGLLITTVLGDYHKRAPVDEAHRARISELGVLLDRMGPVNVDAVREHAEAEQRFSFYSEQRADLDKALDDLEKAIAQMNKESKKLFRATFEGINVRFRALFPKMFRGGAAELRLTNPEDMLETGIEILAQPPGKKLGNIELMSGGEKALTAVSLIFAIFQYKPSPFCVLDEVDAPLDEANVARYNEAIRSMTHQSQFILITHIKKTMQSVDVLYGVTMQEAGVSRLVSVRVNESQRAQRVGRPQATETPAEAAPEAVAVA